MKKAFSRRWSRNCVLVPLIRLNCSSSYLTSPYRPPHPIAPASPYSTRVVSPQPLAAALRLGGWASGAYLATYGFKKAWSACSYPAGETLLGMQTKVALGVAHFCGYLAGKVSGVALVARLPQHRLRVLSAAALPFSVRKGGRLFAPSHHHRRS